MSTEADTCRKFVMPKLQAAGWNNDPHSIAEQHSFTGGRTVVRGNQAERNKTKRADYLLRYTRDFPIVVTEAKAEYKKAADGLQQAKDYAEIPVPPLPEQGRIVSELDALQVEVDALKRLQAETAFTALRHGKSAGQSVFVPLRRDKGEL